MPPRSRAAAKPAPEPEVVEDEFEEMEELEDDTDDLEEVAEEEPKPKTKPKAKQAAPKAPVIKFGSPWLATHITEITGELFDARAIRMLLRKMAADGTLDRVVGETRERYSFSGPEDPTVKAVLTMVKDGTAKELKQAGLEKVKEASAAKRAEKAAAKAAAEAEMEDVEEVEEEDEKPAPRRKTTAKPTAPTKAAPSSTRRRTAAAK